MFASGHPGLEIKILYYCTLYSCCYLVAQSSLTLRRHGPYPTRLLCPWDSPGKNIEVGCHFLLQEIFPTQAGIESMSPAAPPLQADSLPTEPPGKQYTGSHAPGQYCPIVYGWT